MVSVTHALQILITAKDATGKGISSAGSKVTGLVGTIAKAGAKILAIFASIAMAIPTLIASIASIPFALAAGLGKLTEYAAELDLVRRAFLGISGEGAPAMLKALKESSAFMVEEVDLLQTYNKAYTLLGKNLADKLPEMMKHLTKVAAATGDDVTRLAELTIRSVGRMSTRWMAYVGVVVTVEEAELRAAEMFGVMTEELTRQQKQAGLLELTLERLEARTSNMPEVMGTAAQMVAAFRVESKELYGDLTTFLLPVTRALFPVVMKIVVGFRALISESGALYRPIRTVTATLVVLTEVVGKVWDSILEFTTKGGAAIEGFADKLISMGWKAISWGANLIVNFASGMIKGASIALIAAMNFIGGLLANWLAPGSPPLIASNIDEWGAGTFTEWLKGFAMADFDVLEGIQAPLRRALEVFVGLGRMAPLEAFYLFQGLTEDLTAAIVEFNQTGVISGDVLERLAQVGGGYGESLAELFRRYAGLAAATRAYAEAQERLKRATEAEDTATKQLSKEAREYNKLLRAGADPAVLRGKLAQVKASYASLVAARKEKEEAEEAEERAKEQLRLQREQVRLQERLLNQLISMAEAMLAAAKGTEDALELPELEWPEVHPLPIDQAFEDLKERIRKKFEALWDELSKTWEDSEAGKWVQRLQDRWDLFRTDTLDPMLLKLGEIKEAISVWATETALPWLLDQWDQLKAWWEVEQPKWTKFITEEWGKWKEWWEIEGPRIGELIDDVKLKFEEWGVETPSLLDIIAWGWETWRIIMAGIFEWIRLVITLIIDLLKGDWAAAWETFKDIWKNSWDTVDAITRGKLNELLGWIGEQWENLKATASEKWEDFRVGITAEWALLKEMVDDKLRELSLAIQAKWAEIVADAVRKAWEIRDKVVTAFASLALAVSGKILEIYNTVTWKIQEILNWIGGKWSEFWMLGYNLIKGLGDGIGAMAGWLLSVVTNLANSVIGAIKRALGIPGSASSVGEDLGSSLIQGLADGMGKVAALPAIAMNAILGGIQGEVATGGINPSFATGAGGGGRGGAAGIVIHNHFGKDSVRSSKDIYDMTKQMQRSLTLRGARTVV